MYEHERARNIPRSQRDHPEAVRPAESQAGPVSTRNPEQALHPPQMQLPGRHAILWGRQYVVDKQRQTPRPETPQENALEVTAR